MERYSEIILSITAFELLFFGIIILIRKTNTPHFKILGLFLVTKGLCVASSLLGNFYTLWISSVPYLYLTGSYLAFTFGPLMYLFIRSLTSGRAIRWIDSIHFIPLILAIGFFSVRVFVKPLEMQVELLVSGRYYPSLTFHRLFWGSFFFLTIVYLICSWILVSNYHKKIRNHLSSFKKIKINWLYPVLAGFFLIILIDASNMYVSDFQEFFQEYKIPVLETVFLIFANLFIYIGLTEPIIKTRFDNSKDGDRYLSSRLNLSDKREILQTIRTRMSKDLLYLDPELSIEKLSKVTGTSARNLSQVINEILNQNFYEFVNSYRISAAKKQLEDTEDPDKTVLEILYAVGFNSKSVFNACFKKFTGLTPTQYRRQKLNKLNVS